MAPARPRIIGVVHLAPLPGCVRAAAALDDVVTRARADAELYVAAGMDGLILENHGDAPFARDRVEPHIGPCMTVVARELASLGVPLGINVLRNDAHTAMGVAAAAGAAFVRVNVLTGATATDQGVIEGCAATLMPYRDRVAPTVGVFADVNVKFGTPLYSPPLATWVSGTVQRALADAVIITGHGTGSPPTRDELRAAAGAAGTAPVYAGSGVTAESVADVLALVHGVIVGSDLKEDGYVENAVSPERVAAFMAAAG